MAEITQIVLLPSEEAASAAESLFPASFCVYSNGKLAPQCLDYDDAVVIGPDADWRAETCAQLAKLEYSRIRFADGDIGSIEGDPLEWVRSKIQVYTVSAPQVAPAEDAPAGAESHQDASERDWSDANLTIDRDDDERAEIALHSIRMASAYRSQAHQAEQAENSEWPDPTDHFQDFPLPPFDPEWLPPQIRQFVVNIQEQQGCDLGIPAMHAISLAAICISDDIKVSVRPRAEWFEPPRLWSCVVGPSGDGKSPSMSAVLSGISALTVDIAERSKRKMDEYKDFLDVYEAQRKSWIAAKAKNEPAGLRPEAPQRPVEEQLYFDDFTVEGIADVLQQTTRGSSCIVDELLGLMASFNKYRPGNDRQFFLSSWSGGPRAFNRAGGRKWTIPDCGLSMMGNSQPRAIQDAVKKQGMESDGLIQRVLVYHSLREADAVSGADADIEAIRAWKSLCERLYHLKTNLAHCYFSRDAQDIFHGFELWLKEQQSELPNDAAKEAASKWRGYAARLALVFHCIESAQSGREVVAAEIHEDTMSRVVSFMTEGLFPHLVKFYAETIGSNNTRSWAVRQIANWIVCLPDESAEISLRDIAQNCRGAWYPDGSETGQEQRRRWLINEFTTHTGWLRPVAPGKLGQLPTRYLVNPRVYEKFAALREKMLPERRETHKKLANFRLAKKARE